jgi:hypothetical protein
MGILELTHLILAERSPMPVMLQVVKVIDES